MFGRMKYEIFTIFQMVSSQFQKTGYPSEVHSDSIIHYRGNWCAIVMVGAIKLGWGPCATLPCRAAWHGLLLGGGGCRMEGVATVRPRQLSCPAPRFRGTRSKTASDDVSSLSNTWSSRKRKRQNTFEWCFRTQPWRHYIKQEREIQLSRFQCQAIKTQLSLTKGSYMLVTVFSSQNTWLSQSRCYQRTVINLN